MNFTARRQLLDSLLSRPADGLAERHLGGLLRRCPTCDAIWLAGDDPAIGAARPVDGGGRQLSIRRGTRRPRSR
jgi:ABC-type sugar transport system substrate-binding protein